MTGKWRFHKCRECGKKLPFPEAFDTETSIICTDCCRRLWYESSGGQMRPEYDEEGNTVPWWLDQFDGKPEWLNE